MAVCLAQISEVCEIVKKEIVLKDKKVVYSLKKHKKARHLRLTVRENAEVLVTVPWRIRKQAGVDFLLEKADWVLEKIENLQANKRRSYFPTGIGERENYLKYKKLARKIVEEKLKYFNAFYGFSWGRIFIRNQQTCWGSCSGKKNLNFNYKIIYLSEDLCDYVIVHELCHLGELNHSEKFWELVKKTVPDYRVRRKKLRKL